MVSLGWILLSLSASWLTARDISVIPKPVSLESKSGTGFVLKQDVSIRYLHTLENEADYLAKALEKRTGHPFQTFSSKERVKLKRLIVLNLKKGGEPESYTLKASPKGIYITGADAAGVFYGVQTLLQLIPLEGNTVLPNVVIKDAPRFGWRGMHFDVARHMYSVENVKKFIDWLAVHKMNTMHWHLTEDQGWRIEIKKYPKLTEIGGYRDSTPPYLDRKGSDGKRYGGFYTQEQIKDIVAYAAKRHVTIVPEIDMPGHMAAAIAAYPWLGNNDIPNYNPKVASHWGVFPYVLAPKEETFKWVDDVLEEVCDLFPSKYIHIGGDEAPKGQWKQSKFAQSVIKRERLHNEHELQSYFIKRVDAMLTKRGRKLIGWDEIREGGLSANATVMLWRGWEHAIHSVNEGHDVVMAPTSHTYFDYYQAPRNQELAKGAQYEAIGGHLPIQKVYSLNPVPKEFQGKRKARHILGTQAQLWSEYMKTWDKLEYMAFPRLAAIAEVGWTPQEEREFDDFMERLKPMLERYKAGGVSYFDPFDSARAPLN